MKPKLLLSINPYFKINADHVSMDQTNRQFSFYFACDEELPEDMHQMMMVDSNDDCFLLRIEHQINSRFLGRLRLLTGNFIQENRAIGQDKYLGNEIRRLSYNLSSVPESEDPWVFWNWLRDSDFPILRDMALWRYHQTAREVCRAEI
jgi:hypothetical protein